MPHYCPISSTVLHTFTTPTHLTHPPPPLHHHCRTNSALSPSPDGYNTLATNTHANRSLSHEPKTRSPPPPSLPAQQAAQAIHSSPPASASLFTSLHPLLNLALVRPPRTGPSLARTKQSGAPLLRMASHARKRYKDNRLSRTCTPGCLWERFLTSHLAHLSPCMAFSWSRSRPFRYFYRRALIHWMYRNYANALSISIRNHFTYIGGARWSSCA